MGYWNPERNLGVVGHFLEIIKQQLFLKAVKYKAMYGVFIRIEALLSLKKCMFPPSFLFKYQEHLPSSSFST